MLWFRALMSRLPSAHQRAFAVIAVCAAAILLDSVVFAHAEHIPLWHAWYVILANAETFGGDVGPSDTLGYVSNVIVLLLLIPLVGTVISLVTSGWTERHVKAAKDEIKQHTEDKVASVAESAAAAHRIAADLHLKLTGKEHPDAPKTGG